MAAKHRDKDVASELTAMLSASFPGITVEAGHSERWDRMCVTFRWAGFAGLLAEERFQRLARLIPDDFRDRRLAGFVWLELAPDDTVDGFLKLPRSEDVADREATIYAELVEIGFFESLAKSLGRSPDKNCGGDLSKSAEVLSTLKYSATKVRDAKLLAIRLGAYCDCQVLQSVQPALAELHAGAA